MSDHYRVHKLIQCRFIMDISLHAADEGAVEDVQVDRAAKRDASSTPASPSSAAVVKKVKRDATSTSAGDDWEIDEDAAVELQT